MGENLVRLWVSGALVLILLAPGESAADFLEDAGKGAATVAANVVYMPTKLVYATLGGVTGGLAYLLTGANQRIAEKVWTPSLGGHYVINRDQLWGKEILYFSGPVPASSYPARAGSYDSSSSLAQHR